ncbi:MAG TPA: hypothetical protein VMW28_02935 [Pelolinea sp.]|nr:hypothetical protein [Pelolinea sp.]
MSDLHQKKFYSSDEVDRLIEQHAKDYDLGYSAALRDIVEGWAEESAPKVDPEYWNTPEGIARDREYGRN